jgi:LmbE family N-acetylglucosaminyl deacetylase
MIGEAARSAGARVMLGPAGVGGHVDHLLCRWAVVNAAAELKIPALLWRDEPYGSWQPEGRRRGSPDGLHLAYSPPFLERKLEAVGCYTSQLAMMWPDGHGWREAVAGFGGGRRSPGETFWNVGRG